MRDHLKTTPEEALYTLLKKPFNPTTKDQIQPEESEK